MNKQKQKKNDKKEKSDKVRNPSKGKTARLYALWDSIPTELHRLNIGIIEKIGFDIKDDVFVKLIAIKTKTEFSKEFNVNQRQLRRWDKSEIVQKWKDEFNLQSNVLRFKKDIDFHFTKKAIREADAARIKLWKQLYEGFAEKTVQSNPAIEELAKAIKTIAKK